MLGQKFMLGHKLRVPGKVSELPKKKTKTGTFFQNHQKSPDNSGRAIYRVFRHFGGILGVFWPFFGHFRPPKQAILDPQNRLKVDFQPKNSPNSPYMTHQPIYNFFRMFGGIFGHFRVILGHFRVILGYFQTYFGGERAENSAF